MNTIGLLLGEEEDWPRVYECLIKKLTLSTSRNSRVVAVERVRVNPFGLNDSVKFNTVIERVGGFHDFPREWLKKASLIDGTYIINNPFTVQSMEKHSTYSAMVRLGLHIPETWLVPPKQGPDTALYRTASRKYNDLFNIEEIADRLRYPLYMKPYNGGGGQGVLRINNVQELTRAYDHSGQAVMHLQASIEDYDAFIRAIGVGPQVIAINYDPVQPLHNRYVIYDQAPSPNYREACTITKIINAFFGWDFNSCELIVRDGIYWPIDFANPYPDLNFTRLHYFFPNVMKSLVAWSVFCAIGHRQARLQPNYQRFFAIADSDLDYYRKLAEYEKIADEYFEVDRFNEFLEIKLPQLNEVLWQFIQSSEFDNIMEATVRHIFPEHERTQFLSWYQALMQDWVRSAA